MKFNKLTLICSPNPVLPLPPFLKCQSKRLAHLSTGVSAASCAVDSACVRSPKAHHSHSTRVHGQLVKMALEKVKSLLKELETSIEELESTQHSRATDDFPYRVIHLDQNPFDQQIKSQNEAFAALKGENERLRARLELLESGNNADITRRIDDAVDQARQIEILKQTISDIQNREQKIIVPLRKNAKDLRQASSLLLGYRIDLLNNNFFKLCSIYDEEQEMLLKMNPNGCVSFVNSHRVIESFPAFLAELTLNLLKKNISK